MNIVVIEGVLARRTERPVGETSAVEFEVRTALDGGGTLSVPVVAYGDTLVPPDGERVVVRGRVRMRFFRAGGATVARTEVVVDEIVPSSRRRVRTRVLREASALLGGA